MTKKLMKAGVLAIALSAISSVGAVAATLDGETIRASSVFPTLGGGTTGGPIDAVVGAGVEFVSADFTPFFGPSFDFAGDTITITHTATGHQAATFNGWIFNDVLSSIADFTGLSIVSDSTGFFSGDPSRLSFDADNLYINFESLSFASASETVVLRISTAVSAIPVPASLPLMALGLGGLGFMARRKRKAA